MDLVQKIVTSLPLRELWRSDGFRTTSRARFLNKDDISSLLRGGRVQFVTIDVGSAPNWVSLEDCYDYWKDEVVPHLNSGAENVDLNAFPGGYCYFASEWDPSDVAAPIVVLERHH